MLFAPVTVNSTIPVALVSLGGTSSLPVSLASKNCKTHLQILGIYPNELEFKKCFEETLE